MNKIKFWDVVGSRHKGKAEERIKKCDKCRGLIQEVNSFKED